MGRTMYTIRQRALEDMARYYVRSHLINPSLSMSCHSLPFLIAAHPSDPNELRWPIRSRISLRIIDPLRVDSAEFARLCANNYIVAWSLDCPFEAEMDLEPKTNIVAQLEQALDRPTVGLYLGHVDSFGADGSLFNLGIREPESLVDLALEVNTETRITKDGIRIYPQISSHVLRKLGLWSPALQANLEESYQYPYKPRPLSLADKKRLIDLLTERYMFFAEDLVGLYDSSGNKLRLKVVSEK